MRARAFQASGAGRVVEDSRNMDSGVMSDQQRAWLTSAVGLMACCLQRFATVPDVKPKTVIASPDRISGIMLFRSFAPPGRKLMDTLFVALVPSWHALAEEDLENGDATTDAAQLSRE